MTLKRVLGTVVTVLLLALVLVPATPTFAEGEESPADAEARAAAEMRSTEQYTALMEGFGNVDFGGTKTSYPDYYAGAYVDADGQFFVLLTKNTAKVRAAVAKLTGKPAPTFLDAKYSYNYLDGQRGLIDAALSEFRDTGGKGYSKAHAAVLTSLSGWGVRNEKNSIVVTISKLSKAKEDAFRKHISSSPAILFEEGEFFTTTGESEAAASGEDTPAAAGAAGTADAADSAQPAEGGGSGIDIDPVKIAIAAVAILLLGGVLVMGLILQRKRSQSQVPGTAQETEPQPRSEQP